MVRSTSISLENFLFIKRRIVIEYAEVTVGMVALVRTVVGVSLVGGLLVVLLWSEQQVGVKTPAHTHFHAHARGIPPDSLLEESSEKLDE
ncbi:hypothetical protein SK128_004662 [Halocaridina rubra]|uniref:Uncharacterized protein n=1 Tax=Halocaridina rubra TaxID=373956 RepID=A0AAN8XWI4_HALRR